MVIKGDLRDLYVVGEKKLPEMAKKFTEAANDLVATNDSALNSFSRTVDSPNPALESATEYGGAFASWEEYRNSIYNILAKNATKINNAAEFIVGAADDYAYQDGHNADEIDAIKDEIGIDKDVTLVSNNRE